MHNSLAFPQDKNTTSHKASFSVGNGDLCSVCELTVFRMESFAQGCTESKEQNRTEDGGWVGGTSVFPRPRADHDVLWIPWSVHRVANGFPIDINHLLSPLGRIDVHSFLIQCKM